MPWKVVGTTVIKSDSGKVVKKHKTKEKAEAHKKALYSNYKGKK